jgi:shikimate dehydrogenase
MQNAGIDTLGLDWKYLAFEVPPEQLKEAVEGARSMRFLGLNLTVPHKLLAVSLVDELDDSAAEWGAVNTIRFEARDSSGAWVPLSRFQEDIPGEIRARGFNTDADAIVRSVEEDLGVTVHGAKVVVLGAGGAGRTAALKLASQGVAELHLVNRTEAKAGELADEIRGRYGEVVVETGYPTSTVDWVLNATSLGLKPGDPSPLDTEQLPWSRLGAVYDMIYRPAETRLLREARAVGCPACNGVGMLLYQGVRALELWAEREAPVEVMRHALETHLEESPC